MGTITDIKELQKEGKSEREIIDTLRSRGISYQDISEGFAQAKIKEAIGNSGSEDSSIPASTQGMEPSMLTNNDKANAPSSYFPSQQAAPQSYSPQYPSTQQAYAQEYTPGPGQGQEYSQDNYQYQPTGIGSDTITEIAEQVVAEKFSSLKEDLDKLLEIKTNIDGKIEYLDERLKRIEKIIDRLQLSVLQKVGDYITNVEDIKNELVELEKTLKVVNSQSKK